MGSFSGRSKLSSKQGAVHGADRDVVVVCVWDGRSVLGQCEFTGRSPAQEVIGEPDCCQWLEEILFPLLQLQDNKCQNKNNIKSPSL